MKQLNNLFTEQPQVLIIGAGQMGQGIAQVCLTSNYSVALYDVCQKALEKAFQEIQKKIYKLVNKQQITAEEAEKHLLNLHLITDLKAVTSPAVTIEAIVENLEIKKTLLEELSNTLKPDVLIASNTSALSIEVLAGFVKKPERFLGLHFMNPPPLMPLVEIIFHKKNDSIYCQAAKKFIESLNKIAVVCKDSAGFIVNRILLPAINEAINLYANDIASSQDIDLALVKGANWPMGPLQLADFIGLDTCLSILHTLGINPHPILQQKITAGHLGKKSGQGFFVY